MDAEDIIDFLLCHGEVVKGLDADEDFDILWDKIHTKYFRPDWSDFNPMHPDESVCEFIDHEE